MNDLLAVFLLAISIVLSLVVVRSLFVSPSRNESFPFFSTFDQRWPPISEDEFMKRCPLGSSRRVALTVRRIISEQTGFPYDQVYPEQNFVNDLDC